MRSRDKEDSGCVSVAEPALLQRTHDQEFGSPTWANWNQYRKNFRWVFHSVDIEWRLLEIVKATLELTTYASD